MKTPDPLTCTCLHSFKGNSEAISH